MIESAQLRRAGKLDVRAALKVEDDRARRSRRVRRASVLVGQLVLIGGGLLLWEAASRAGFLDLTFFSRPTQIYSFLVEFIGSGEIWRHLAATLEEFLLAFIIGSAMGIGVGLLLSLSTFVDAVITPIFTLLNALPRVALAPMFLIWFGIGQSSKVALGVSLVFFIMLIATQSGTRAIDNDRLLAMRAMGASRIYQFRRLILPSAVPAIFGALRLSVIYALTGTIFGEMLGAQEGIGQRIQYYSSMLDTGAVLGLLFILALMALILNEIVVRLESYFLRWDTNASR